jgi:hypothetical protein
VVVNLGQQCWSREQRATAAQPRVWEGVLGGGEDVGRCLTYIGKRLGFVWGFRVGPWINRLMGANGPGRKECNRIEKWAMVRKPTGPW